MAAHLTDRLDDTPVRPRLEWLLDGLEAADGWGTDASAVLAPALLARNPPFADRLRQVGRQIGAFVLTGLDAEGVSGRARLRCADGELRVLHCSVEAQPPHRISTVWIAGWIPEGLAPPLPQDFSTTELPHDDPPRRLIVFAGVPGTGKSSLSDAVGARLCIPVFAADWLLGALTPFGGRHLDDLLGIGYEQLTTLAYRQFQLGQSAILDAPAEEPAVRARWCSLAARAGARLDVICCICSDPRVHQDRLERRGRGIAGWHDAGHWPDVERRIAALQPWEGDVLTVDAVQPFEVNLAAVLERLGDPA